MKLFLINPNFKKWIGVPSLGLGFIGTHIRRNSAWEVEVIEPTLEGLSTKSILEKIQATEGEVIVGLVCYTETRFECFGFAQEVKTIRPDATVIVGGVHSNCLDELILQHYPQVDIAARGEAEDTVLDIISKKPLAEIAGITWRDNGKIVRNPDRELHQNLDVFDFDYELLATWIRNWKDLEIPASFQSLVHLPIIVSRGCKFNCSFCGSFEFWRQSYRVVSNEEIVRRLKYLVETYNVGFFRFYDALFLGAEEERIFDFCRLLKKEDLKIIFRIDLRIGISRAVLEALKDAGCRIITFGVESGSDHVLKAINKGITRKQIIETCRICRELGFWILGAFMISMPAENLQDVKENFKLFPLFNELNYQDFKIHPGTPIYKELKQSHEIDDEVWFDIQKNDSEYFYCKESFPSALLSQRTVEFMLLKYYLLPLKLKRYLSVGLVHPRQMATKLINFIRLPFFGRLSKYKR